jgi:hypothetical protein
MALKFLIESIDRTYPNLTVISNENNNSNLVVENKFLLEQGN